jgi:hypothetical protein
MEAMARKGELAVNSPEELEAHLDKALEGALADLHTIKVCAHRNPCRGRVCMVACKAGSKGGGHRGSCSFVAATSPLSQHTHVHAHAHAHAHARMHMHTGRDPL